MATAVQATGKRTIGITLLKKSNTLLALDTDHRYMDGDVEITMNVQEGTGAAGSASADATIESTQGSAGGTNISGSIGSGVTSEPSSGYYVRVKASASGRSKISAAGWMDTGNLPEKSANKTLYFPISAAQASVSGSNTVTPSASIAGNNVTLSNVNNGIKVTATGGGTAVANASAVASQGGYVPANGSMGSATLNAQQQTTQAESYLSGVTLVKPSSGTRSFSISFPYENETVTVTYTIDASGNVTVSDERLVGELQDFGLYIDNAGYLCQEVEGDE